MERVSERVSERGRGHGREHTHVHGAGRGVRIHKYTGSRKRKGIH